MGVINVTPDSFSDGGRFLDPSLAVAHGAQLVRDGAQLLDVGGESTRPGAEPISAALELERVLPVLRGLVAAVDVPLSIDTTKAEVAAAALAAGATWVNDVSAGRFDPAMLPLVAETGCTYVAMHMRGRPRDMQVAPRYEDAVAEVLAELRERVDAALAAGVSRSQLVLDPGIGFGKRLEDNLDLLAGLERFRELGLPLLVGVSRKSFLGALLGRDDPGERIFGTAAAVAACTLAGCDVLRVHDVREMAEVVRVAAAIGRRRREVDADA